MSKGREQELREAHRAREKPHGSSSTPGMCRCNSRHVPLGRVAEPEAGAQAVQDWIIIDTIRKLKVCELIKTRSAILLHDCMSCGPRLDFTEIVKKVGRALVVRSASGRTPHAHWS